MGRRNLIQEPDEAPGPVADVDADRAARIERLNQAGADEGAKVDEEAAAAGGADVEEIAALRAAVDELKKENAALLETVGAHEPRARRRPPANARGRFRYRCLRDCYWNLRRWTPDNADHLDVAFDLEHDGIPPYHFEPLDGGPVLEPSPHAIRRRRPRLQADDDPRYLRDLGARKGGPLGLPEPKPRGKKGR